jgi:hypothetical protein
MTGTEFCCIWYLAFKLGQAILPLQTSAAYDSLGNQATPTG